MNRSNENQHYVSQVLLGRFKTPGRPLFRYSLEKREWSERSLARACSAKGYNQWIENGAVDNSFEACFSQVESLLPKTFKTLEDATARQHTILDANIYENLCRYCTMLKLSSPAAKAGAVANFVIQVNLEIERGERWLLRDLGVPESLIAQWTYERNLGRRVILDCDNPAQFAFRFQYNRTCDVSYAELLRCDWRIIVSPLDLPMSDIGLVPILLRDIKANQYLLPIGPRLLLVATHYFDQTRNSREPKIQSKVISTDEAESCFETICASAVSEIIAKDRDPKVLLVLAKCRTGMSEVEFNRVTNPRLITSAGMLNSKGGFALRTVSREEYRKYVHSFVTPPRVNQC